MTESEAIERLKCMRLFMEINDRQHENKFLEDDYIANGMAIQALKKQIPKNVYHFTDDDTFETSCCGTDVTNKDYKYCPECGQLLGEVEEVEEYNGE